MNAVNSVDFNQIFEKYLKKHKFGSLKKIALAVSGGPDSMALLHSAATYFDGEIAVITVDHQLRAAANKEAQDVGAVVLGLNNPSITHHILKWDHDDPAGAIMEKARQARYELMAQFCEVQGISLLLTAHHQDDQAETFLIRLIKGSGLDGLAGIEETRPLTPKVTLGRPFLSVGKAGLVEYCTKENIPFVDDPSNEDDAYLRPRLRQFMDGMAPEGLDNGMLARTANRLQRAKQALYHYETKAYDDCVIESTDGQTGGQVDRQADRQIVMDYSTWHALPDEIAYRVMQRAMESFREEGLYPVRMNKLEDLIGYLKNEPEAYTDRTLGGTIVRLKHYACDKHAKIIVEKEASS